jgi:hypothetical protein
VGPTKRTGGSMAFGEKERIVTQRSRFPPGMRPVLNVVEAHMKSGWPRNRVLRPELVIGRDRGGG